MSHLFSTSPFYYGVPPTLPVIPGFEVIASPKDFLTAKQGEKRFVVTTLNRNPARGVRLFPIDAHDIIHEDRAIFIPAP